jgi:hypothetical protein
LFSKILQLVLVVGNYLNGTTFRGNAYGFKIDSLLSIEETVAVEGNELNCSSLMNYLARYLLNDNPECLDFLSDMPDVALASKISIPAIIEGVKELTNGFSIIRAEITAVRKCDQNRHDNFLKVFERFYDSNNIKVQDLEKDILEMSSTLEALFINFAEDPKARKEEPQLFFETILKFSISLKVFSIDYRKHISKTKPKI